MYDSIMTYVLCYRFGLVHIMLSFWTCTYYAIVFSLF